MERDLTKGNIVFTLAGFSLPLILSGVLQQLYNWADAFIVGNIEGELALAAVGATGTITNLFVMVITGLTLGLSILAAQKYGRGERESLRRILSTFSIVLGVLFLLTAAAGLWLSEGFSGCSTRRRIFSIFQRGIFGLFSREFLLSPSTTCILPS